MRSQNVGTNHEERLHASQSRLLTQEADSILLDTLQWMQENKNACDLDEEIWDGNNIDEEKQKDLMEYMKSSQRECDDIVFSAALSAEAEGMKGRESNEEFGENGLSDADAPSTQEGEESSDYEPLNLVLTLEEDAARSSDSDLGPPSDKTQCMSLPLGNINEKSDVERRAAKEGGEVLSRFRPITAAPSYADVKSSMRPLELPDIVYSEPFFSNPRDVPNR